MAEIRVEKKKSIWPWILGLLLLALILWAVFEAMDRDEPVVAGEPVETVPAEPDRGGFADEAAVPAEVEQFASTCVTDVAPEAMGREHEYTVQCIEHLAASISAVIERPERVSLDLQQRVQEFEETAQRLEESDPESQEHAGMTREVFVSAADLLNSVQEELYIGQSEIDQQVSQLEQTAAAVKADTPMLEQREDVQAFFQQAADALRNMARAEPRV